MENYRFILFAILPFIFVITSFVFAQNKNNTNTLYFPPEITSAEQKIQWVTNYTMDNISVGIKPTIPEQITNLIMNMNPNEQRKVWENLSEEIVEMLNLVELGTAELDNDKYLTLKQNIKSFNQSHNHSVSAYQSI